MHEPAVSTIAPSKYDKRWLRLGLILWILPWLVITVMVVSRPTKRTVTPLYHDAVKLWEQRQSLYAGPYGMNYLPSFIPVFTPYHAFPVEVGDVLWRSTAFAGFAMGIWILTRKQGGAKAFALVTLIGLPLCLGALRNGQANAHLGMTLLAAAACLYLKRWTLASIFLGLAVAIKPLGLAAVGLAFAAYPHLWWRLGLSVVGFLLLPFAIAPTAYVQSQYVDAYNNLRQCSEVTEHRFADINGFLRTFGIPLVGKASLLVRAGAGALFALLCFVFVRRQTDRERALSWLAFSAAFLMLFNPMNESNSYAIFGPVLALWAWQFKIYDRRFLAWTLFAMLITMSVLPNLLRPWLGNSFALAWHPAMTALFITILIVQFFSRGALPCLHKPPRLPSG